MPGIVALGLINPVLGVALTFVTSCLTGLFSPPAPKPDIEEMIYTAINKVPKTIVRQLGPTLVRPYT